MTLKRPSSSSGLIAKRKKSKEVEVEIERRESTGRGEAYVIGEGFAGQLGLGTLVEDIDHLASVKGLADEDIIQVAAGGMHTLCLSSNGRLFSFGCNDQGALGRTTNAEDDWFVPHPLTALFRYFVTAVSCGDSHSSAITSFGRLFLWGTFRLESGENNLLGPMALSTVPVECFLEEKITRTSSGNHHLLLLTESNRLLSIGSGERGQLGRIPRDFMENNKSAAKHLMFWPEPVIFPREFESVEIMWAGSYNSFARTKDGTTYAWGLNNYHQLGFKDVRTKYFPAAWRLGDVRVDVKEIRGGDHHTLVLDKRGRIFSIGKGHYGQLGRGEDDVCQKFFHVSRLSGTACSSSCAGLDVSYAVSSEGELYAWGQAGSQLGSDVDLKFPRVLTCSRRIRCVSTRGLHAVVLARD